MKRKYNLAGYSRENNKKFRRLYEASGLTKQQISATLRVSLPTVIAWTKAEASKSSYKCPAWAVEKLRELVNSNVA